MRAAVFIMQYVFLPLAKRFHQAKSFFVNVRNIHFKIGHLNHPFGGIQTTNSGRKVFLKTLREPNSRFLTGLEENPWVVAFSSVTALSQMPVGGVTRLLDT